MGSIKSEEFGVNMRKTRPSEVLQLVCIKNMPSRRVTPIQSSAAPGTTFQLFVLVVIAAYSDKSAGASFVPDFGRDTCLKCGQVFSFVQTPFKYLHAFAPR